MCVHCKYNIIINIYYPWIFVIPHLYGSVSATGDQQAVDGPAPDHVEQPVFPGHFVLFADQTFFRVVSHQKQSSPAFESVILRRGYGKKVRPVGREFHWVAVSVYSLKSRHWKIKSETEYSISEHYYTFLQCWIDSNYYWL